MNYNTVICPSCLNELAWTVHSHNIYCAFPVSIIIHMIHFKFSWHVHYKFLFYISCVLEWKVQTCMRIDLYQYMKYDTDLVCCTGVMGILLKHECFISKKMFLLLKSIELVLDLASKSYIELHLAEQDQIKDWIFLLISKLYFCCIEHEKLKI